MHDGSAPGRQLSTMQVSQQKDGTQEEEAVKH